MGASSARKRRREGVTVPAPRRRAAQTILPLFEPGRRVVLTTHVNADGDGAGSEVALWHCLTALGVRAVICNPSPFPARYAFLLRGCEHAEQSREAVRHVERADAIVVLDISDLGRLGNLGHHVERTSAPVACIDHHLSDGSLPRGPRLVDPEACATGELIYDLVRTAQWPMREEIARALYVALLTDTGGFRFSNTTARTLRVAAHLLESGADAEAIYQAVYASEPVGRMHLLAEVLQTLVVEPEHRLAWITVPPGALERHGLDPADLEGVVELPRSIRGVDLAILFRLRANGLVKASFRSVGDVDVAELAQQFGGGGHRRAAGASLEGDLDVVQTRVLEAARALTSRPSVAPS